MSTRADVPLSDLHKAIRGSLTPSGFDAAAFFHGWYRDLGSVYTFVFRKNLSVTNIQFAELLALLRLHVSYAQESTDRPSLQFINSTDFRKYTTDLVLEFPQVCSGDPSLPR